MLTRRVTMEMMAASALTMLAAEKGFSYLKSLFASRPKTVFDEDFFRRQNPEVALELSQRWLDRARTLLAETKPGGSFEEWNALASSAISAEGHARQLFEIARIRARDTLKSEPQS
ncbi:MAG: hypothetical protein U1E62_18475 [Alsobacter sp.]